MTEGKVSARKPVDLTERKEMIFGRSRDCRSVNRVDYYCTADKERLPGDSLLVYDD